MAASNHYLIFAIVLMSIVTMALRMLPFAIFSRIETPPTVQYLGHVLPYVLMPMLVIYCLKDVDVMAEPHGLPELLAVLLIIALQLYKKNTLVSIFVGTVFYMYLVQSVF